MRMNGSNMGMKRFVIVMLALVGIVVIVLHSSYVNVTEMENQLRQNLQDVASQNAVVLHMKVYADYEMLQSLAEELVGVTTDTIDKKLGNFKIFLEEYQLKRFAYCFPDGTTYSTDGSVTNLSYREFFTRGMAGKCTITGMLRDAIGEEHTAVNVMTIPIYDEDGNVTGVFGLTYESERFNESLQVGSFEGQGYSCAVNENGEIMAVMGSDKLELSHNLFSELQKADERNAAAIESLREQMEEKTEKGGTLYLSEKNYYYCSPVELMDEEVTWYILTIIPSAVLESRVMPIQANQYRTSFLVGIFIVIGAALLLMFSKEQQRKMTQFVYEDPITKGANYAKFILEIARRHNRQGYLVMMDITNFNNITIAAGKAAGENMIRDTWKIISKELRTEEIAAHIRDDVFILFLVAPNGSEVIDRMEVISGHISEKAKKLNVYGIHAGYGIYRMDGSESFEDAYSKAKVAREHALTQPELHYAFYDEINHQKLQEEKQLEERFPEALADGEFEVWYQPKYSASSCEIVGSEALVRWRDKDGKLISPGKFIPLFEHNGMIMKLDEYMFRAVCRQQEEWLAQKRKMYPVSINISRASLYYADVLQRYSEIMKEYKLDPKYVQLEVTETALQGKSDICNLLEKFREMGVKILMDDFGTGYSSLATLSMHCFDTLKLDKTLIDHIGDKDGETLLFHVIHMGQQLGLHITAEGVENQGQLKFLQGLKCDDIQGFYFAKPMPGTEYETML